jgi:hypothetical protein
VRHRALGVAVLVTLLATTGCDRASDAPASAPSETPETALDADTSAQNVVTVDVAGGVDPSIGATPMAQRVATLGLLNKRNGQTRDVTLRPGETVRVGDVVLHLKACEQTAPWEQEHYTGAFVQVDVSGTDKVWRRVFSGWLFKERPGLNVVQHPIYDVWTKSCAMTFPEGGPDSVAAGAAAPAAAPRSSAKKSAEPDPEASGVSTPDSALDNSAR